MFLSHLDRVVSFEQIGAPLLEYNGSLLFEHRGLSAICFINVVLRRSPCRRDVLYSRPYISDVIATY